MHDYGWHVIGTDFSNKRRVCLPINMTRFLALQPWSSRQQDSHRAAPLAQPKGAVAKNIMQTVASLGNSITANTASKTLTTLHEKYPRYFRDPAMKARALAVLSKFPFKHNVRRFVWETFEITLDDAHVHEILEAHHALEEEAAKAGPEAAPVVKPPAAMPPRGTRSRANTNARKSQVASLSATIPLSASVPRHKVVGGFA